MSKSNSSVFSAENLMMLGILDEVYDLYQTCYNIVDNAYTQEKKARPNSTIWPAKFNHLCKKPLGVFLDRYIHVFASEYYRMYLNDDVLKTFSMYDVSHPAPLNSIHSIKPFSKFIEELKGIIIRSCFFRKRKRQPRLEYEAVEQKIYDNILEKICQSKVISDDVAISQNEILHTIWVYKNISVIKCIAENHSICFCTAHVYTLTTGECVNLVVRYCQDCNRYFISDQTLSAFENKYGLMLVRKQYLLSKGETAGDFYSKFQTESKLHSIGYNVRSGEMDEQTRRKLLVAIIDKKLMTPEEICKDIENAISIFRGRSQYYSAIRKWEADLIFISESNRKNLSIYGKLQEPKHYRK